MNVLITGGAGFIGTRLAERLVRSGNNVTVLDVLNPQIHGPGAKFNTDLLHYAKCVFGDVRNRELLKAEITDVDVVVHLASETGTGQSMYSVRSYTENNIVGTSVLLDIIINERPSRLRKIVVASSRAIYGEGKYNCVTHGAVYPGPRTVAALDAGRFEPVCPICGGIAEALATDETAPCSPSSYYAVTKQFQEQTVLLYAAAAGMDACALRYQNVYGPGQSLKNPYTGILAIFSTLARQDKQINVFEDGLESRDFVYIDDVVGATSVCISNEISGLHRLNVGSGVRTKVIEVAERTAEHFSSDAGFKVTGQYRVGDIRHNFADITRLVEVTGFRPKWSFAQGLKEFLIWADQREAADPGFETSLAELQHRKLLGSARS